MDWFESDLDSLRLSFLTAAFADMSADAEAQLNHVAVSASPADRWDSIEAWAIGYHDSSRQSPRSETNSYMAGYAFGYEEGQRPLEEF